MNKNKKYVLQKCRKNLLCSTAETPKMDLLPFSHIATFLVSYDELCTWRLISKITDDATKEQRFCPAFSIQVPEPVSLEEWRRSFPAARECNISSRKDITDVAFFHLAGIHTLNMSWCRQSSITDVAFSHLAGIHTLDMSECHQSSITDATMSYLGDVPVLIR